MKWFGTILVVGGFCLATLGAAGFEVNAKDFDLSKIRSNAALYFGGGLLLLVVGGILSKTRLAMGSTGAIGRASSIPDGMNDLQKKLADIDDSKSSAEPAALRDRVDALLRDEFFDLTSRHEELAAEIGFSNYAKVWEGVASAERLLNRYWSMATDGHHEEALVEIPLARAHMDRAARTMSEIAAT